MQPSDVSLPPPRVVFSPISVFVYFSLRLLSFFYHPNLDLLSLSRLFSDDRAPPSAIYGTQRDSPAIRRVNATGCPSRPVCFSLLRCHSLSRRSCHCFLFLFPSSRFYGLLRCRLLFLRRPPSDFRRAYRVFPPLFTSARRGLRFSLIPRLYRGHTPYGLRLALLSFSPKKVITKPPPQTQISPRSSRSFFSPKSASDFCNFSINSASLRDFFFEWIDLIALA